jgi:outer membrane protein assembly factor BamB
MRTSRSILSLTCAFLIAALPQLLLAQEWTRYRGPNGSGLSDAETIPTRWSESSYNWKVELPGPGHSQPVFWGEKIFLTSALKEGAQRVVLCLRAKDGGVEWKKELEAATHPKHVRNTYASSTPAVDEERVYVVFSIPASYSIRAFDHGGKELWSRDLGPFKSQHGNGSSPIVFQELVVLGDEQDGESSILALDRKSGEVKWKVVRTTAEVAYGTPCILSEGGRSSLIFSSHAHGLTSIDPSSGAVNWEARVWDKRTVSSPVLAPGLVIGTCGSGGGGNFLAAVRPGGKGDVTKSHLAYKLPNAENQPKSIPYVPTPLVKGDLLFLWGDHGVLSCVEVSTGKLVWQERAGGEYSGSPVCVGERLFCISEDGEVVVAAAAREFKVLARNPLGEGSRSTPAVAGGRMYLRTYTHLFSVGGKRAGEVP